MPVKPTKKKTPKKKKKAVAKKDKLSIRERKFIKALMAGDCPTEAMRKAGYAENTARVKAGEKLEKVKPTLDLICEEEGLTDKALVKTVKEGLEANKVISANVVITKPDDPTAEPTKADSKTVDFIDVPDWQARLKAADMGFKVKGGYAADKVEHSGSIALEIKREIVQGEAK